MLFRFATQSAKLFLFPRNDAHMDLVGLPNCGFVIQESDGVLITVNVEKFVI